MRASQKSSYWKVATRGMSSWLEKFLIKEKKIECKVRQKYHRACSQKLFALSIFVPDTLSPSLLLSIIPNIKYKWLLNMRRSIPQLYYNIFQYMCQNETARRVEFSIKVPCYKCHQLSFSNDTNEQSSISEQAMFQNAFQANHLQNGEYNMWSCLIYSGCYSRKSLNALATEWCLKQIFYRCDSSKKWCNNFSH